MRREAGADQHLPRGRVDLEAADGAAGGDAVLDERDGGVAGPGGRRPRGLDAVRDRGAGERHPGDVGEDRARRRQLAPQIEEQHFVPADGAVGRGGGEVVRVAGVGLRADDRGAVAPQVLVAERLDHLLLDVELGEGAAGGERGADEGERPILDPIQADGGVLVRGQRGVVPDRLEPLDEVARRHHLHAVRPHQLDGAGVDPRQVGDGAVLRVFHRQPAPAGEQGLEALGQRVAPGVDDRRARNAVQVVALDGVDEPGRRAFARDRGSTSAGWPCGPSPRRRSGGRRPGSPPGSRTAASRQGHPRGARLALPRCRAT